MIPIVKKEAQTSELVSLSDIRFELFDRHTKRIAGKPATLSEIAVQHDCPYILKGYGRRMFTDSSVAGRIFTILGLQESLFPNPSNIDLVNEALKNSNKKKMFFVSLIEGTTSAEKDFSEMILMDVIDPRKIRKEIEEDYDR